MRGRIHMLVISTTAIVATAVGVSAPTVRAEEVVPASTTVTDAVATPESDAVTEASQALENLSGDVAVAVMDVDSGATFVHGASQYDTASIVKVNIVVALLLKQGGELSSQQAEWATAALQWSDNASATNLYAALGGATALDAANEELGLTETTAGINGYWGLTQTTAADQLRLLTIVFGGSSPLGRGAQHTVQSLMSGVVDSQRFGITAASEDPSAALLKVGYLQRSATGWWDVSSIGRIEADGREYLIAVLSEGSSSFAVGVRLIEGAAREAITALQV